MPRISRTKSTHFLLAAWAVVLCLLLLPEPLHAQTGVNSPSSRYGFGSMADRSVGFNKAMGGVAQGFRNGQEINPANPASYSAVDSLTALFDLGFSLHNGNYKMGELQQNAKNASFDYFAFQFRAFKGVGIALGIVPYTNIDYSFESEAETIEEEQEITVGSTFAGSGGLHQVFLGIGAKIFKPLSIGLNAEYIYGDYSHASTVSFSESSAYSMIRGYTADISTFRLEVGAQIEIPFDKKNKVVLGGTYGFGHDVNNKSVRYTETVNSSSYIQGYTNDTLRRAFELPMHLAVGLSYQYANHLRVGADFEMEQWSKVKFPTTDQDATSTYTTATGQMYDYWKASLGAEYIPDPYSRNYFKRVAYKIGGYYANTYTKIDQTGTVTDKPFEYGVTAGLSLPIQNRNLWYNSPKIHITFSWVHAELPYLSSTTLTKGVLKENYLKLSIGLTFSERWFYKWKVD